MFLTRCIEIFAVILHMSVLFTLFFQCVFAVIVLMLYGNFFWRTVLIVYLFYVCYDHKKHHGYMHGNGSAILRNNFIYRSFRNYFPIELVKTEELTPERNYILACFPHGVMGAGVTNNMSNDIRFWLKLFPGIRPKLATLNLNLWAPFERELFRRWGLISASKQSLLCCLNASNDPKHADNRDGYTSNAVAIMVGGAQEAFDAHPRQYVLTLRKRKGFVKIAITTGAALVPSFSFGEVDIFEQVKDIAWLHRFQTVFKNLTGVSPIVLSGRGALKLNFLPERKRIVQVVGAPILVEQSNNPDPQYIEEIHNKFIMALTELFETHKMKYIPNAKDVKLIIN